MGLKHKPVVFERVESTIDGGVQKIEAKIEDGKYPLEWLKECYGPLQTEKGDWLSFELPDCTMLIPYFPLFLHPQGGRSRFPSHYVMRAKDPLRKKVDYPTIYRVSWIRDGFAVKDYTQTRKGI